MPNFTLPRTTRWGSRMWVDPAIDEVVRLVQEGDPTVGWSGDPCLGFYLCTEGRHAGQWELVRFPEDGSPERIIARSQPGVDIRTLPAHLAYHDTRRRGAVADLEREAAKAEQAKAQADDEEQSVAVDTWLSRATRHAGPAPQRAS